MTSVFQDFPFLGPSADMPLFAGSDVISFLTAAPCSWPALSHLGCCDCHSFTGAQVQCDRARGRACLGLKDRHS